MRPKVETCSHGVRTLAKIANMYQQLAYSGLEMLIQHKWQYLQIIFPRIVSLMNPIEDDLREAFFPSLFGGEEFIAYLR